MGGNRKAWVVGGEVSLVNGNFGRKLGEVSVDVQNHLHSSKTLPSQVPTGTDCVIIIKDMISHALFWSAVELAKGQNLPYAIVPRKFVKALPMLKAKGIVETPEELQCVKVSKEALGSFVESYVSETHMIEERIPSYQEVDAAAHTAFNGALGEDNIEHAVYERCKNLEVANMSRKLKKKEKKEEATKVIQDWTELVVDETPALVKDVPLLTKKVQSLMADSPFQRSETSVSEVVGEVAREIVAYWDTFSTAGGRSKHSKEEQSKFVALKLRWYEKWAMEHLATKGKFPSWRESRQAGQNLFGSFTDSAWKTRAKMVAAMKKDAVKTPVVTETSPIAETEKVSDQSLNVTDAFEYYLAVCKVFQKDPPLQTSNSLRKATVGGKIKGWRSGKARTSLWFINLESLQDWLAEEHGMDIRPAVRPGTIEPVPTPTSAPVEEVSVDAEPSDVENKLGTLISEIRALASEDTAQRLSKIETAVNSLAVLVEEVRELKTKESTITQTPVAPISNEPSLAQFLSQWGEVRLISTDKKPQDSNHF
jgi:hypothetical protein